MRKLLLLFFALLTGVGGAWATTTWESKSGWTRASGGTATIFWFGAQTPGSTSDVYSLTSFQLWQEQTGNACYLAIATASATSKLSQGDVIAISTNQVTPSGANGTGAYETYNFQSVKLIGGTTYYMVFLSSNTPTDGEYPVVQGRISLNHTDYGTYTPGCSNAATSAWWPNFTAELAEESTEIVSVTYVVKDSDGNTLFTSTPIHRISGTTITNLPSEFMRSDFYTYNSISQTITSNSTVEFTATPKAEPLVNYSATEENPIYRNLKIRSQYLVYNTEATGEVTLQTTSDAFNTNAAWAFIGNPYAGFKIINQAKGTGYNLTYTSVVTGSNSTNNIQFVDAASASDKLWYIEHNSGGFVLRMKENTSIYFHHNNSGNNKFLRTCSVTEWSPVHNDEGSTIIAESDDDVLFALYEGMKDKLYGPNLGQYVAEGYDADAANTVIDDAKTVIDNRTTGSYATTYTNLKNLSGAATTYNEPKGKFVKFKNVYTSRYLGTTSTSGTKQPMVTEAANAGLYFITSESHLLSYDQTLYLSAVSGATLAAIGDTGGTFTIGDGRTGNTIHDGTAYLVSWESSGNYYVDRLSNPSTAEAISRARWTIEEVTEIPVTIGTSGYATFYSPVALTLPSGLTAYVGEINEEKDRLTLTTTDVIPALKGVILEGETGNYTLTVGGSTASTSDITGSLASITTPAGGAYTLTTEAEKPVFKSYTGETLTGFKAYIDGASVANAVKAVGVDFLADAISALQADKQAEGKTFDLNGRQVKRLQKGIYIVNGRKVVIR